MPPARLPPPVTPATPDARLDAGEERPTESDQRARLLVCNRDDGTHAVDVTVREGTVRHAERYRVPPRGERASAAVPPGTAEVTVTVDGERTLARTCRVADGTATVLVEVGNGAVAVTVRD